MSIIPVKSFQVLFYKYNLCNENFIPFIKRGARLDVEWKVREKILSPILAIFYDRETVVEKKIVPTFSLLTFFRMAAEIQKNMQKFRQLLYGILRTFHSTVKCVLGFTRKKC